MRFAYADPPYYEQCSKYGHRHEPGPWSLTEWAKSWAALWGQTHCWDDLNTHHELIAYLESDFPDGWVLSCSSPSLYYLMDFLPKDARFGGWFKSYASFKPGVGVAYAWEPVIFRGGRPRSREQPTVRDWVCVPITVQKGLTGAKPARVCEWILEILNYEEGDELADLFPGTGVMANVLAQTRIAL